MLAILTLVIFLGSGALIAWAQLPRQSIALRVYLGLALGMAMLMWLPSLVAFALGFTLLAQWIAMGVALALAALGVLLRPRSDRPMPLSAPDHPPLRLTLALLVPFMLLGLWLLHTHTIREVDGALHVGQSTFGDLSLHLGIATGLRGAGYPPDYTLLPGTLLGYPFLADAAAGTLLMTGATLRWAFLLTSGTMLLLVYWGFIVLSWNVTRDWRCVWVAFLLLFLNGGLGFIYSMDALPQDASRFLDIFTEFYRTPTNQPDLNLRWSNVLADLLVPQRTLLAGWMMVIPALLLLQRAVQTGRRGLFVCLGVWAALMPMVHTHSFLALGIISVGAMGYSLWKAEPGDRIRQLVNFVLYGAIALALALPQLMVWTFPQTAGGNSLRFSFNWVNGEGGQLRDGYLWFWIKNVGPVYLLMVPAALMAGRARRRGGSLMALSVGALVLYVLAELLLFQPNAYDNNKLFYVAFLWMVPLVAMFLVAVYDRLKGIPGRGLLAGALLLISVVSGSLTLVREAVSDYELFSPGETAAARYIDQHAEQEATFVTGQQHNNPVSSLAGRRLVCGTPTFLYYHGLDYSQQQGAVRQIYQHPEESRALMEHFGVDYIYVSDYERADFAVDESTLSQLFPVWYENDEVSIYRVQ